MMQSKLSGQKTGNIKDNSGTHLEVYTNQLKELVAALNDNVLTAEYKKFANKA